MQVTLSAQSSQGSFQADRERDILSAALGNNEHPGRTRCLGLYVPWKYGFREDSESYRSRKRAKAERDAKLREEIRESLKDEITESIRDEIDDRVRAETQRRMESFEERLREVQLQAPAPTVLASPPKLPSSCASNPNPTPIGDDRFPVDDIRVIINISGMLDPLIGLLELLI